MSKLASGLRKSMEEHNQGVKQMFRAGRVVNGVELALNHAFGINSSIISNQLQIVGEDRVVFMMGSTIVVKELRDNGEENFYAREGRFRYVTALQCLGDKQAMTIFLGESSLSEEEYALIVMFETERGRLKLINTGCKGIIRQLVVHEERGEVCALINSGQNLQVVLHNYERNRLVAQCVVKFNLEKVSMHPLKERSKQLYFMGSSLVRLWNVFYQEQTIKESYDSLISLTIEKDHKFNDHCWTSLAKVPTLVIVAKHLLTNKNRVILLQNDKFLQSIDIETTQIKSLTFKKDDKDERRGAVIDNREKELRPDSELLNLKSIQFSAVAPTRKGLVLGGSRRVLLMYDFEKALGGEDRKYTLVNTNLFLPKQVDLTEEEKILRIHLTSTEQIINFNTINQIGSMNFYIVNTFQLESEGNYITPFFRAGFHTKRVHSLSRAVTKSYLVSCSEDNNVKVWNFYQNDSVGKSGLLTCSFQDEPLNVTIHPSGLFIAVSFSYGLKIYAVVSEELVIMKESQLPNCRLIRYSNGGQYLVVNQKEHIFVFDTVYYETLHLFSLTSPVQEITLSDDDLYLVTTCSQGYVYCKSFLDALKTSTQKVMMFAHQEPTVYNCIAYDSLIISDKEGDPRTDLFVGATTQKYMVLYKNKCKDLVAEFPVTDCYITCLLICKGLKVLFAGTSTGRIRVYLWPLDESNLLWEEAGKGQVRLKPPPFYELQVHASSITALVLSQDQKLLCTGAEDGTIMVLRVYDKASQEERKEKATFKDEDKKRIDQTANDIFLQKLKKIKTKNESIQKFKTEVVRSEQRLKMQKEKLDDMSKQNIENRKKEFNLTLESERKMKENYIENSQREYENMLAELRATRLRYQEEIDELRKANQKKVDYETKRNQLLNNEIEQLQKAHEHKQKEMRAQHQRELTQNKIQFFKRCQQQEIKYSNIMEVSHVNAREFIEQLDKTEHGYEQQIERQIKEKTEEIQKVVAMNEELKVKNDILLQTYCELKAEDERLQLMFEEKFKEHNNIRFENLKSDQDILKMQHQLLERLQVIDSKEETCKNARYEQATLENFRYILDSKIDSLEEKKKEMILRIQQKENNLKKMLTELVKESQKNETKYRCLRELHSKITVLEKEVRDCESQIDGNQKNLAYLQSELLKIIKADEDTRAVAQKLRKLLEDQVDEQRVSLVETGEKASPEEVTQVNDELQRQNKWMGKKLEVIRVISQKEKEVRESNKNSIINQNIKIIKECTGLREDNETLKSEISKLEKDITEYERRKGRLERRKPIVPDLSKLHRRMREQDNKLSQQRENLAAIESAVNRMVKDRPNDSRILKDLEE